MGKISPIEEAFMEKKCAICGKTFETKNAKRKYCDAFCREAGRRLNRILWEVKNNSYYKDYMERKRLAEKTKGEE